MSTPYAPTLGHDTLYFTVSGKIVYSILSKILTNRHNVVIFDMSHPDTSTCWKIRKCWKCIPTLQHRYLV